MRRTTVCLVFHDSCGCGPTPGIHLRAEHPGWRSMVSVKLQVKRDLGVTVLSTRPGVHATECYVFHIFSSIPWASFSTQVNMNA
jgi:hypothetical protein